MREKHGGQLCLMCVYVMFYVFRNLVEGRRVFKVTDEIASLDFAVTHASSYIGRTCGFFFVCVCVCVCVCWKAAKATT